MNFGKLLVVLLVNLVSSFASFVTAAFLGLLGLLDPSPHPPQWILIWMAGALVLAFVVLIPAAAIRMWRAS